MDIVYLWANTTDPHYIAARNSSQSKITAHNREWLRRFSPTVDHGELRLALRSVHLFAPFVRNVFILTSGQVGPGWLDELGSTRSSSCSVTVVDGHALLAEVGGSVPSFSNHALYLVMHRIPGLSETFLNGDDDVIFARPAQRELFVNGSKLAHYSTPDIRHRDLMGGQLPAKMLQVARATLSKAKFAEFRRIHIEAHTYRPYRKSDLAQMWELYQRECLLTVRRAFRTKDDLVLPAIYPRFMQLMHPDAFTHRSVADMAFVEFSAAERESTKAKAKAFGKMLAMTTPFAMVFSCPGQLKPPSGPSGLYSPLELLTAVRYENSFHVLMANIERGLYATVALQDKDIEGEHAKDTRVAHAQSRPCAFPLPIIPSPRYISLVGCTSHAPLLRRMHVAAEVCILLAHRA
jgi:hypothetical protein